MFVRLRLRERIHVGIALHTAVNLGFGLAVAIGATPAAQASAAPAALDPSPALERAAADFESGRAFTLPSMSVEIRSTLVRRPHSSSTLWDRGLDRFDRLALCESGGDPRALSPSGRYRGAFQFTRPTWSAAGGTGDPIDVSYSVQKRIAMDWAHVVEPSTQWPVCWPRTS